jgi:hypothetical protein
MGLWKRLSLFKQCKGVGIKNYIYVCNYSFKNIFRINVFKLIYFFFIVLQLSNSNMVKFTEKKIKCCSGITSKGLPCKIKIEEKFSFCFFHQSQSKINKTKCCSAVTKGGLPCKKKLSLKSNSEFCYFHKNISINVNEKVKGETTPQNTVSNNSVSKKKIKNKVIDSGLAEPFKSSDDAKLENHQVSNNSASKKKIKNRSVESGLAEPAKSLDEKCLNSNNDSNKSGFTISKPKSFLLSGEESKVISNKVTNDSDDIFIYPANSSLSGEEATEDDIFEFVRR